MKYSIVLSVKEDPEMLFHCLKCEQGERERSSITLKKKRDELEIKVGAKDATALKASMASVMNLLSVFEKSREMV